MPKKHGIRLSNIIDAIHFGHYLFSSPPMPGGIT